MSHSKRGNTLTALIAMLPIWIIAVVSIIAFSECQGNNDVATPRRTAYPRISLCDTVYKTVDHLPIKMEINAQATAMRDSTHTETGSQWVNITYPGYNATIFCTFTPTTATTFDNVISNRVERISLNIGDAETEITELTTPAGVSAQIAMTLEATVTPVQFIAAEKAHKWVLSGALYFNKSTAISADSVAPIVKAVRNDVIHMLNAIENDKY